MQRRDRSGDWKLLFRRSLFAREEEEVSRLQVLTRDVPRLNVELHDAVRWTAFTVPSVRDWFELNNGPRLLVLRLLWNNVAPPKAQFLSWLA